ncbi:GNAT family protein [Breoghania sp. L-A4]|uniref:GNAT family N-acetyltransferase n=1 Tax=Breoghania sp. L-A4 TaxID=2304600 RepID=UPI000E35BF44|nr:GNAT family protein [Breoghania sp. L-A4]AXS39500.1 N-acetyltransferase [Breoghania sp. L-A4]
MAFFGTIGVSEQSPVLRSQRLYMRAPVIGDYPSWSALRALSRDFLTPWEPSWPEDDLTRSAFRRRLRRYLHEQRSDRSYTFFVFKAAGDILLGGVTLSSIRRGVTQSCSLGYWIGQPHARNGYMSEAVSVIVPFIFDGLRLHRCEAACLPQNQASIGLLQKAGFTQEGYARGYLKIAGQWQDHVLFARLAEDAAAATLSNAALPRNGVVQPLK